MSQMSPNNGNISTLSCWAVLFLVAMVADIEKVTQKAVCPCSISDCGESHKGHGQQFGAHIMGS